MAKFECSVCGYIFDEQQAGIKFSEIMECPICAESRDKFNRLNEGEMGTTTATLKKEEEKKEEPSDKAGQAEGNPEKKSDESADGKKPEENASSDETKTSEEKDAGKESGDNKGFVIEKRQEFWLNEKDKEDGEVDRSNIQTYYDGVKPVKSQEELDREAKEKEERERPRLDPIEGNGAVHTVIDGGDRSSDGSDSEVVVVEEAASDVDTGDDEKSVSEENTVTEENNITEENNAAENETEEKEAAEENSITEENVVFEEDDFVFEENTIESTEPLETQEIPAVFGAGMSVGGDFFTGVDNNPNLGDKVRTEEFFFDDEEPVGEVVEIETAAEEAVEDTAEEVAEEAVEEVAEEAVEEVAEEAAEEVADETAEEAAEETIEETAEEVAEEPAEETEEKVTEEAAEKTDEEKAETAAAVAAATLIAETLLNTTIGEESEEEDTTEETVEETAEETVEEVAEEAAEEAAEEVAEEAAEEVAEETAEETVEETAEEAVEEVAEEAAEEAVEEVAEEVAEETAEETVEETAEEAVEEVAEEAAEEAVEEVAEEVAEESAEETVEETAEETVEEAAEETAEEAAEEVGTGFVLDKKYSLLADAETKSLYVLTGVGPASNGLEGIILLPAQLDPMPMSREEEINAGTILGKGTNFPLKLDRPFGSTDLFLWGEYIPGSNNTDELSDSSLVLVRGKNSHIPNVSGKEELRKEVAKAKELTGGTPIGISLVIGRIEQDLAACVYAGVDFVVLNDVSSGMLPYALRRAKNYLNHVNSEIELIVSINDVNDAKELAKLVALGADFILLEREYDEITTEHITDELKEIARNTGHKNVHDLNMLDICTIDSDLAKNTDIAHF